ncbi:xanthine dehydrogenase family protein molybdopterin-binding subunit [Komagataeibacter swingsii]|uniref:Aldehyde dehydrogenase n=1 Tax=Komagataeibacter swingsii TaxID=215220 RepID=A0A2V4QZI1_9PROT|nr:molybdopterin cofactor-binding domain-containing protein [Komagataeibacter swingsii]PYD68917.1 aldehyde dehydrogenase [Komagataeibacter swingsii]GBQ63853.1 aldehyde dehydrogenase large subunit [Komagataeibacter swingsii DSM 16373]
MTNRSDKTAPSFVCLATNTLNDASRRRFLIGGGLLLAFAAVPKGRGAAADTKTPGPDNEPYVALGGFVRICADNQISLIVPNIEMGQGIYTAEAMLIAEELEVAPGKVHVLTALPQETSDISPDLLKSLSTGGSRSIRKGWLPLRQAGAAARLMLLAAAANRWGISMADVMAENGIVRDTAGRHQATYGDLVTDAVKQPVPNPVPLKEPGRWKLLGKSIPRVDIPAKITGQAVFGIDVRVPKMAFGAVMACPVLGGTVRSVDARKARAMPGVRDVVNIGSAVAVTATSYWTARKGLAALGIVWNDGANASLSTDQVRQTLHDAATHGAPVMAHDDKGMDTALAEGKKVERTYDLPFLAHATMEPINTTIHVRPDGCDVWVGTQVPTRGQDAIARITKLPREKVYIHNYMIGGSFGRRLAVDSLEQAASFACQLSYPVKFIWTREEDIRHDLFRPAYHDRMTATLGDDGLPVAWMHHVTGPSVVDRFSPGGLPQGTLDRDAVAGAVDTPYTLSHMRVMWTRADTPVPVSWWRGVGPAHNAYVVESFMDELAAEARMDPIEYRRRLLSQNPRSLAVLDLVARQSLWGQPLPPGSGRGVSLHNAFGSHCAVVVEVSVLPTTAIQIVRVTAVVDCGMAINPDSLIAQMEGGLLFGFSAALYGEITIRNGCVEQSNFHNYQLMRINEIPRIDVHIINSGAEPGGIGEVGTVSAFPALGNALFAATGKRFRRYPFRISGDADTSDPT